MLLSIIIVNFKNPALLRLCLKSLQRVIDPQMQSEILIVDVASSVATKNVVREEFPTVRFLPFEKNIGYTKGVNEGLKASSGEYILILNPDIVPLKNSVENMVDYMKKNPDIGLLGPCLLNFDGTPQQSCFGFYNAITIGYRRVGCLPFKKWVLREFLLAGEDISSIRPVDWLMGSALMTRRDAVNKIGSMDERFFLYFSDVDWAKRFWENDYKVVFYPLAKTYHYHSRASKRHPWFIDVLINRRSQQHICDGFRYLFKWGFLKSSKKSHN